MRLPWLTGRHRSIDGSAHLWVGRRKRTGRGAGSSGMR
jgi:hypothetical protein